MRFSKNNVIVVSIGIALIMSVTMFVMSTYPLEFLVTASAMPNSNIFGIKGQVMTPPSYWHKIPDHPYLVSFSVEKGAAITGFDICKDSTCVNQDTRLVLGSPFASQLRIPVKINNIPWQVGDNVDIRIKVSPTHIQGQSSGGLGAQYSDLDSEWIDLGTSQIIAG